MTFRSSGKLDTGHGPMDGAWIRYGKIKDALTDIKDWMNKHKQEIVVIYFGNMLGNVTEGHKVLKTMLENEFSGSNGNVGLNDYWQKYQEWPTLKSAKGGFQLEFISISLVINHMTCYRFECSHWWKIYSNKISSSV